MPVPAGKEMKRATLYILFLLLLVAGAAAHEVYVLNSTEITTDFAAKRIDLTAALSEPGSLHLFVTSGITVILGLLLISYLVHTKLSAELDKRFSTLRKYAHLVIRVGLGISLTWGAYQGAIFGPEIPLTSVPGGMLWQPVLFVAGLMLIFGVFTRVAAAIALVGFSAAFDIRGLYMLTYLNYLGEIAVLLIERGELFSVDQYMHWPSHIFHKKLPAWTDKLEKFGETYSFPIIRIAFGAALLWAAIQVKILHPALSLDVLSMYPGLHNYWGYTALFFLLGATIVEIIFSLILIFGVFYRIGVLLLATFIGASVLYFGESVWPHIILWALCIGLFLHGKDKLCLEDNVFNVLFGWTRRWRKSKNELSPE